jgi:hypothetical protein
LTSGVGWGTASYKLGQFVRHESAMLKLGPRLAPVETLPNLIISYALRVTTHYINYPRF